MPDLFKELNSDQIEAVKKTDGPVLILAGAGSGKTRVLTYKVAHLIDLGIKPENILSITFTNKAANEMKGRVLRLLHPRGELGRNFAHPGGVNQMPYVGTFHAFCARLLRIDGKFIGLPSGYVIYDDDDSLSLVKRIMKEGNYPARFKPTSILNAISSAKSELITPTVYAQSAYGPFGETVLGVYREYQKELIDLGVSDFDDLIMRTVELFETYPNVLEKWSNKYKYVLVDEYQDVNTAQYVLTKQLASVHKNLTVVGDASQAIYSFRGADFRNILNFERDFPNVTVFNLEQNYRSTQTILNAANAIILHNSSHPVLKLWTSNPGGEAIDIYNARDEIDEANFIVNKIFSSNLPFSSFAVLYRTNAQSRTIEEAFLHAKIPYHLYGGVRFYSRKEIKDVMAYLRLIEHPKDKVARERATKLGKRRFEKFERMVEKFYLGSDPKRKRDSDPTEKGRTLKPIELIDKVLEATDYLLLIDDGSEQGLSRVENVKELKSVATDFENLSTFLESVALMEGKVTPDKSYDVEEEDSVTLMTVHAAKGLEFDIVFIIGMEEGLFPHARSMMDPTQMEEERRLAYVAVTRARQKLYLTYTNQRLYFGTQSSNLVSRFVVDIPEDLVSSV